MVHALDLPAAFVPAAPALAAGLIGGRIVAGEAAVARTAVAATAAALAAALVSAGSDPLGGFIAAAIAGIALIVCGYAARAVSAGAIPYARMFALIATATAGALTVAIASDLRVLAAGWCVAGIATSGLLGVAAHRPAAQALARRHFAWERIGDLAWIVALVVAWRTYGTFDLAAIGRAAPHGAAPVALALAFVVAGAVRSAQLPLHGWLPNSMEAPTPVSAFMHAGIVNGAGVLLAKTAAVLVAAPAAMTLAAVLGAATAATAATVALVRPEAKRRLGWSTVAQMGFMLLQCGCGAFAASVVHLVAHGGYKSAAFLGVAGSIEEHRRARLVAESHAQPNAVEQALWSIGPPTAGVLAAAFLARERLIDLPAAALVVAFAWAAGTSAARGAVQRASGREARTRAAAATGFGVAVYLLAVVALDAWIGAGLPHVTFEPLAGIAAAVAIVAGLASGLGVRPRGSDALYTLALMEGRGVAAVPRA